MHLLHRLFLLSALLFLPFTVQGQGESGVSLPTVWRLDELLYAQVCVVSPAGPRPDSSWQSIAGRGRAFRLEVTSTRKRLKKPFGKPRPADVIQVTAKLTGTDKEGTSLETSRPEYSGDSVRIAYRGMPLKIEADREYLVCEIFGDDEEHSLYHVYIRFVREKPHDPSIRPQ